MKGAQWVKESRHRKGEINGGWLRRSYIPVFVLPLGSKEVTIPFADDNHADGFDRLLSLARDLAEDPDNPYSDDAAQALKLLGERNA